MDERASQWKGKIGSRSENDLSLLSCTLIYLIFTPTQWQGFKTKSTYVDRQGGVARFRSNEQRRHIMGGGGSKDHQLLTEQILMIFATTVFLSQEGAIDFPKPRLIHPRRRGASLFLRPRTQSAGVWWPRVSITAYPIPLVLFARPVIVVIPVVVVVCAALPEVKH